MYYEIKYKRDGVYTFSLATDVSIDEGNVVNVRHLSGKLRDYEMKDYTNFAVKYGDSMIYLYTQNRKDFKIHI